jgi:hypothetical protein
MTAQRVAALMGFVVATLVVFSTLHLTGVSNGGAPPHGVNRAGIAEATIAVVLVVGILGILRAASPASRSARSSSRLPGSASASP